jgi:hypothetical protein
MRCPRLREQCGEYRPVLSAVFDGKPSSRSVRCHTRSEQSPGSIFGLIVDFYRLEKPVILKLFKHALKLKRKKG